MHKSILTYLSHRNVSEPLQRRDFSYAGPTNQVAEIKAAIKACEILRNYGTHSC